MKNQNGFSLLELILTLFIGSVIAGVSTQILASNLEQYTQVHARKSSLGDIRHAMNQMTQELLLLDKNSSAGAQKITLIANNQLSFIDESGVETNFRLFTDSQQKKHLYRASKPMVQSIRNLAFVYKDQNGNAIVPNGSDLSAINQIRQIQIQITTEPQVNEGSIVLQTTVVPRDFLGYENYQ